MRYARITHTYLLPVPADQLDGIDSVLNAGVSHMERMMMGTAHAIRELRSEFELVGEDEASITIEGDPDADITFSRGRVPRRYVADPGMTDAERESDSILSKKIIEADADAGITFVSDVMGQRPGAMHPWDQGLSIFPEDHPLRQFEDRLRAENDKEALDDLQALSPKLKELPPGD